MCDLYFWYLSTVSCIPMKISDRTDIVGNLCQKLLNNLLYIKVCYPLIQFTCIYLYTYKYSIIVSSNDNIKYEKNIYLVHDNVKLKA